MTTPTASCTTTERTVCERHNDIVIAITQLTDSINGMREDITAMHADTKKVYRKVFESNGEVSLVETTHRIETRIDDHLDDHHLARTAMAWVVTLIILPVLGWAGTKVYDRISQAQAQPIAVVQPVLPAQPAQQMTQPQQSHRQ